MADRMADLVAESVDSLRHEPTAKRARAFLAGELIVDTGHALLVWEPRRVVPANRVPATALSARLIPPSETREDVSKLMPASPRLLDPSVPFALHSCGGGEFDVVADERVAAKAFGPTDPDLCEYVILRIDAFDWFEEDVMVVSHPRDPFKRIDALATSRAVQIESDGRPLTPWS